MAKKPAKSSLRLVPPTGTSNGAPPRKLGAFGANLWQRILSEYEIEDAAGLELLTLACQQLDRAESLRAQIDAEGEVIKTQRGKRDHPALRHEIQARAFVAKTLLRLGLNVEPLRPQPGRPAGYMPDDH